MIKLTEGYCIDSDRYNFILYKDGGLDKNNHRIMVDSTYHPTLGAALRSYFNLRLKRMIHAEVMTISEALSKIRTLEKEINELTEWIERIYEAGEEK